MQCMQNLQLKLQECSTAYPRYILHHLIWFRPVFQVYCIQYSLIIKTDLRDAIRWRLWHFVYIFICPLWFDVAIDNCMNYMKLVEPTKQSDAAM